MSVPHFALWEFCRDCKSSVNNAASVFRKILEVGDFIIYIYNQSGRVFDGNKDVNDVFIIENVKTLDITSSKIIAALEYTATSQISDEHNVLVECPRCQFIRKRAKKIIRNIPKIKGKFLSCVCESCHGQYPNAPSFSCEVCKNVLEMFINEKRNVENLPQTAKDRLNQLLNLIREQPSHCPSKTVSFHTGNPIFDIQPDKNQENFAMSENVKKDVSQSGSLFVNTFDKNEDKHQQIIVTEEKRKNVEVFCLYMNTSYKTARKCRKDAAMEDKIKQLAEDSLQNVTISLNTLFKKSSMLQAEIRKPDKVIFLSSEEGKSDTRVNKVRLNNSSRALINATRERLYKEKFKKSSTNMLLKTKGRKKTHTDEDMDLDGSTAMLKNSSDDTIKIGKTKVKKNLSFAFLDKTVKGGSIDMLFGNKNGLFGQDHFDIKKNKKKDGLLGSDKGGKSIKGGLEGTDKFGLAGIDKSGLAGTDKSGLAGMDKSGKSIKFGLAGTDKFGLAGTDKSGLAGMDKSGKSIKFGLAGTDKGGLSGMDKVMRAGTDKGGKSKKDETKSWRDRDSLTGSDKSEKSNKGGLAGVDRGGLAGTDKGGKSKKDETKSWRDRDSLTGSDKSEKSNKGGLAGVDRVGLAGTDKGGKSKKDETKSWRDRDSLTGSDKSGKSNKGGLAGVDRGGLAGTDKNGLAGMDKSGKSNKVDFKTGRDKDGLTGTGKGGKYSKDETKTGRDRDKVGGMDKGGKSNKVGLANTDKDVLAGIGKNEEFRQSLREKDVRHKEQAALLDQYLKMAGRQRQDNAKADKDNLRASKSTIDGSSKQDKDGGTSITGSESMTSSSSSVIIDTGDLDMTRSAVPLRRKGNDEILIYGNEIKRKSLLPEDIQKIVDARGQIAFTPPEEIPKELPKRSAPPPSQDKSVKNCQLKNGAICYALSDRKFVEKGWTVLPTEKVVRKMNVYRMHPANPEFDWFQHNKNKGIMYYDTGEKLAEFKENGRGIWYYRNGRVALDYYDAEELCAQQRFVIYSSGERDNRGRTHPVSVLGMFDYIGNGIVFDHSGKIRLKYNQTEGVVLDRGIGPLSHWKWHTLNDPPVLQKVMIDTQSPHKDPRILKLGQLNKDPGVSGDVASNRENEEMLAIEFENFVKEKEKKSAQEFKPFQIMMKALKINKNFSLKVMDQRTVYLSFRDGATHLKLNLGMSLDSHEIIDTDTTEVGEVTTGMDKFPARTESLAALQESIAMAERNRREQERHGLRLRLPTMTCSDEKFKKVLSKPLTKPVRGLYPPGAPKKETSYCRCKQSVSTLYYRNCLV